MTSGMRLLSRGLYFRSGSGTRSSAGKAEVRLANLINVS